MNCCIITHHYGGGDLLYQYLTKHPQINCMGEPLARGGSLPDMPEKGTNVIMIKYPDLNPDVVKWLRDNDFKVVQFHGKDLYRVKPYIERDFIERIEAWKKSYKFLRDYELKYKEIKPAKDYQWRNHWTRRAFLKWLGVKDKIIGIEPPVK